MEHFEHPQSQLRLGAAHRLELVRHRPAGCASASAAAVVVAAAAARTAACTRAAASAAFLRSAASTCRQERHMAPRRAQRGGPSSRQRRHGLEHEGRAARGALRRRLRGVLQHALQAQPPSAPRRRLLLALRRWRLLLVRRRCRFDGR